ncbi:MAG: hypothetical protein WC135_02605 [Bacteroidales bacterium]
MNTFQENLQKAISQIIKVSDNIISSDKASQLDIDILLEKLRKAYDVAISFETQKQEIHFQAPIIVKKQEKEIEEKVLLEEEVVVQEKEEESDEVFFEESPEIIVDERENDIEKEEQVIEKKEEVIFNKKIEELVEEIKEEVKEIDKEIIEEKIELKEQINILKQISTEPETLFDTESIIEETIEEAKPVETPSVLKYLNEQMPKKNEVGQMFEKKEIEIPLEEKPIEIEKIEEKHIIEKPIIVNNQSSTTIGERYSQNKSVFDNISNSVNKSDISSRFKSNSFNLITAIGVNEKFMFINDLFSGNLRAYTEFIQKLNEAESLESANQILNQTKEDNRWIANSLPYTTLVEIILKKFHY